MKKIYDVIIIGGGASGMIAAVTAARKGNSVLIADKNKRLGRKLLITGKGRCNLTNNCDIDTLMQNIPRGGKFLYSAFSLFSPVECIRFFEELGVKLKTERGNRVFPVSDKAVDIVDALAGEVKRAGCDVCTDEIISLDTKNGQITGVLSRAHMYNADNVVIATGGMSYAGTGSDGAGYKLASSIGHSITEISPSLVPLVTVQDCSDMSGLSLKNVVIKLICNGKVAFTDMGEMLFTHFGISGPLVLSASAHIDSNIQQSKFQVSIDLKPALDEKKLNDRILRDFAESSNKNLNNCLHKLLPTAIIPNILRQSDIDGTIKVNEVTKEQRQNLIKAIKSFTLDIEGFRPIEEAIITRGGVNLKEINPRTMQSKLVKGLYFCGEVLDCDAYTGGFNLQIAFATGVCAGQAIEK